MLLEAEANFKTHEGDFVPIASANCNTTSPIKQWQCLDILIDMVRKITLVANSYSYFKIN